jgi:hypothetical protein
MLITLRKLKSKVAVPKTEVLGQPQLSSLFLAVLLCASCAGTPASSPASTVLIDPSFSHSLPAGNGLVFIGVAGRRSDPKETIQCALEDAARRVAIFQKVFGEYAVENNIGSGLLDYVNNTYTSLCYDEEGSRQYVDALQFNADTDTVELENSLIIRATYPGVLPIPVKYRPTYGGADERPNWVDNPMLEIEGYEAAVSHSARFSSLADTYANSYRNAIFAIIRNVNTVSRTNDVMYQNTGSLFGYRSSSDNVMYSYGTLTCFYVLDTWLDPKTKWVWTLAIARID